MKDLELDFFNMGVADESAVPGRKTVSRETHDAMRAQCVDVYAVQFAYSAWLKGRNTRRAELSKVV